MSVKRLLMIALPLLLLITLQQGIYAQSTTITGKITDKDGMPVSGASVLVKGSRSGVQSGADGSFSITVPGSAKTLVISSIGFSKQEVTIGPNANYNISLASDNAALGEVVVVAYGTRKKADLTGSVTAVSAKDFQKGVNNSPEQLLQGKVPGLQITTGGGAAGGGSKIRIRSGASLTGSNDPLIVIDGVPTDGGGIAGSSNILNTINPNDIESMSVLKDASATALYGSRASNGVIIITTKKGTGGKPKFNFNTMLSAGVIGDKIEVLSGDEMRDLLARQGTADYREMLGTANTNWQDEIFQTAIGFDNNLSVSGSLAKKMPYRFSVGYLNQEGTLRTNEFDRFSTSLNLNPKLFNDHLTLNIAAKTANTSNRFADEGAIGSAVTFDPTQPVYAENKFGGYYEWLQANENPVDLATRNPVALLQLRNNNSNVFRFIGNVQADYKMHFLPDLHVLLNLGVEYNEGSGNDNIDSISATNYKTAGRFTHYEQVKRNQLADVSLFYSKELDNLRSKFDVLAGHSYQDFYTYNKNYYSYGQNGVRIEDTKPTNEVSPARYRLESYLGRVNYTFANKYLLTASIRRDASSRFLEENRVGYFPAVALAWRVNQDFFAGSSTLSDLKLRGSWGVTGQQDIGDYYGYLPRYSNSSQTAQYQFGDNYYTYLRPAGYDPNMKWETTTTINLGLDFGFLDNRITGSVDVYKKNTEDLFSPITPPPGSNFTNRLVTNVGNMENRGIELVINTTPVRTSDWQWDFGFNMTLQESEITKLQKQEDPNFVGNDVGAIGGGTGNFIQKDAVGFRPATFYVYKQVYDPSTGMPIEGLYEDINRDGKIDPLDRYFYKNGAPDFLYGINTQVSYKQFSFGLAAHGMAGNYIYNNVNSERAAFRNVQNPIGFVQNTTTRYFETKFFNNQYLSDFYIENGSFFRLDNINLGYTVGRVLHGKANLRLAASIQNVFVITKYKGLDPELSNTGIDNTIYPRPRIYSLGANLDF